MMNELEFWNEINGIGKLYIEMELLVGLEPVLFVCVLEETQKEKYLVMTYNSSKDKYVMRKITNKEILDMLDKKVSMEETFRNGKDILLTSSNNDGIFAEKFEPSTFDEKMLPRKGATYNINSQYILDYKKELKIPHYELIINYESYEVGSVDMNVDYEIKNNSIFINNTRYQPRLNESLYKYSCKKRNIA